jgi:hypothetical protein
MRIRALWVIVGLSVGSLASSALAQAADPRVKEVKPVASDDGEDFIAGKNGLVPEEDLPRLEQDPARSHLIVRPGADLRQAHPEGEYGGVTPGKARPHHGDSATSHPARPVPARTVTWIGFQAQGGSPVVFVQMSTDVTPEQKVKGKTLLVHFPGAKLARHHNLGRFIDTRFFKTDVTRIDARSEKGGVTVRVSFKDAARQAKVDRAVAETGGTQVLLAF